MNIEVCYTPQAYPLFHNPDSIVVVIDILRATSAITTAFYNGVAKMIPVASIEEAKEYQSKGYMVAAERNGEIVEGFDLGNSPFGYMNNKVKGKTIAITTTNGTQAINAAKDAHKIVVGSFLNLDVVVDFLKKEKKDILFVCAGWKNKFNLEDTLFAGAVVEQLKWDGYKLDDPAIAANDLYQLGKHDISGYLKKTSHSERLKKLGIEKDIAFCLNVDTTSAIPVLQDNKLVKLVR